MYISMCMQGFWKYLLQRNLSGQWLEGLHYAVFGLGDSGYQKFNVKCLVFNVIDEYKVAFRPFDLNGRIYVFMTFELWLQFVAKKLDRRLLDLGATPIIQRGLGDDQHPSGYGSFISELIIEILLYVLNLDTILVYR